MTYWPIPSQQIWYFAIGGLVLGGLSYLLVVNQTRHHTGRKLLPLIIYELRRQIALLVLLAAASIGLRTFDIPNSNIAALAQHTLTISFIALIGWMSFKLISIMRSRMLSNYDITLADNFRARKMHTQISLLYRLGGFLVILVTTALILTTFDAVNNVGKSILASAGVAGIIIGFAAQKTISSIFVGIQIAITQPIRIEDAVVVEGEWGWVEEITLTYVVIRI